MQIILISDRLAKARSVTLSAMHLVASGTVLLFVVLAATAAVYWLTRMLEAGEDPLYVARRLIRFASEDVGMADPAALTQAVAAQQAAHFVGMPEANLALAQAVVYLATAPKSNALYSAYSAVREDVERTRADPVPLHLRNAPTPLMRKIGYGKGYRYAHDYEGAQVDQQHLPDAIKDRTYYHPSDRGYERTIRERRSRQTPEP